MRPLTKPVDTSEAQSFLAKVDAFAKNHSADPLLIAVRYFEVGDRFKNTDSGRKAIDLSLAALQRIGERVALDKYNPAPTDGKVYLKSEPSDASIVFVTADGVRLDTGKKTPSLIQLPIGNQKLEFAQKGFNTAVLSVEVDGKTIAKPDAVKLEALTVPVDIVFLEGWTVFVDKKRARTVGERRPETPCTIEMPLGSHEIGLAKDGYYDIAQRVDVVEGGVRVEKGAPTGASGDQGVTKQGNRNTAEE